MNTDLKLLKVLEVAELLQVSKHYVIQRYMGRSKPSIPSIKIGGLRRFRPSDIDKFIESCRAPEPASK